MQHDVYAAAQHVQSPEQLKAAFTALYQTHVTGDIKPAAGTAAGEAAACAGGEDTSARWVGPLRAAKSQAS